MSFLDENGLSYFYGKLKEKFIRTVNSQGPDANGNVTITNVATADNLTSPDAQASYGEFIYRTSGGSASLSSGEAQLVYIDGNVDIRGRVIENFNISATNGILVTYSAPVWREQISTDGTYVFSYTKPTSNTATAAWNPSVGGWSYDGATVSLASFGLYESNVIAPSISASVSGTGISAPQVVPNTWMSQIQESGTYYFNYSEDNWTFNEEIVNLTTYGITVGGTPAVGDSITITYQAGTPNSVITVNYTAPQQGTIVVATPTTFSATGFNQFDSSSMYIQNATISNGVIASNSGTYLCYCRAKGGVDNGYVAYSEGARIRDIGWCENLPAIGESVITTGQSVSSTLASIPFDEDGYVVVVVTSMNDLCIHPKWSGSADNDYEAYVAPSTIVLPTVDIEDNTIPIGDYGMPSVGSVADRLNLDAGTYIQRIGRLENTANNMSYVEGLSTDYDYDDNYIYYVLLSPITYNVSIDPTYTVNDWGTEEFLGTEVALKVQTLYGQNLRDKLRTDVVTISEQSLSTSQKNQVCSNIGAVKKSGDTMTGALHIDGSFLQIARSTGNGIAIDSLNADITVTPDSTITGRPLMLRDKNGENMAGLFVQHSHYGNTSLYIRSYNASGSTHNILLSINADGTKSVTIEKGAWLSALGLGTDGALPITIAQGGTGGTNANQALTNLGGRPVISTNITSSTTKTISFSGTCGIILYTLSGSANILGEFLIYCSSATATPIVKTVAAASNITITPAAAKVTIASTATTYLEIQSMNGITWRNRITVT